MEWIKPSENKRYKWEELPVWIQAACASVLAPPQDLKVANEIMEQAWIANVPICEFLTHKSDTNDVDQAPMNEEYWKRWFYGIEKLPLKDQLEIIGAYFDYLINIKKDDLINIKKP
jgi:hypothetical protein